MIVNGKPNRIFAILFFLVSLPPCLSGLEIELTDIFLWPDTSTTFIQQFTGIGVSYDFISIDLASKANLNIGAASGLFGNTTGLARWFTRNGEIDYVNKRNGAKVPCPGITPEIILTTPVMLPAGAGIEGEYRIAEGFSVIAGVTFSGSLLFYDWDDISLRMMIGLHSGCGFQISGNLNLGFKISYTLFGDKDLWTGLGGSLFVRTE